MIHSPAFLTRARAALEVLTGAKTARKRPAPRKSRAKAPAPLFQSRRLKPAPLALPAPLLALPAPALEVTTPPVRPATDPGDPLHAVKRYAPDDWSRGPIWSDADIARRIAWREANTVGGSGPNAGAVRLKDRRKPWQKELRCWSVDRTGTIYKERRLPRG